MDHQLSCIPREPNSHSMVPIKLMTAIHIFMLQHNSPPRALFMVWHVSFTFRLLITIADHWNTDWMALTSIPQAHLISWHHLFTILTSLYNAFSMPHHIYPQTTKLQTLLLYPYKTWYTRALCLQFCLISPACNAILPVIMGIYCIQGIPKLFVPQGSYRWGWHGWHGE